MTEIVVEALVWIGAALLAIGFDLHLMHVSSGRTFLRAEQILALFLLVGIIVARFQIVYYKCKARNYRARATRLRAEIAAADDETPPVPH